MGLGIGIGHFVLATHTECGFLSLQSPEAFQCVDVMIGMLGCDDWEAGTQGQGDGSGSFGREIMGTTGFGCMRHVHVWVTDFLESALTRQEPVDELKPDYIPRDLGKRMQRARQGMWEYSGSHRLGSS